MGAVAGWLTSQQATAWSGEQRTATWEGPEESDHSGGDYQVMKETDPPFGGVSRRLGIVLENPIEFR